MLDGQEGRVIAERYRITTLLGQGGMGSVWRAEHLTLGSEVAIKLIDPAVASNPEIRARFVREAKAAASLRSPHVVQIIDYGVDGDTPYIAMELMEGESLAERLDRVKKLSPVDTSRVITEVARALTKAHDAGIIHRDLKPDNVFLVSNDDTEVAKVLDFGVAKQTFGTENAHMTSTGAVMGTPYYMSPEQAEGAKSLDHRTDIWALAVMAYECLLGARPFEAETLGGLFLAICARDKPVPSGVSAVPAGFDEWFHRGTARDVSQRFATAREAAQALRAVCVEEHRATSRESVSFDETAVALTKKAGSGGLSTQVSEGGVDPVVNAKVELGATTAAPGTSPAATPPEVAGDLGLSTVAGGATALPMRRGGSGALLIGVGIFALLALVAWGVTLNSGSEAALEEESPVEEGSAVAAEDVARDIPEIPPVEEPARDPNPEPPEAKAEPTPQIKAPVSKPRPRSTSTPRPTLKAVKTEAPAPAPAPAVAKQPRPAKRPRPAPKPAVKRGVDLGI